MSTPAPYASASLYVGDLAPDVTEAILFEFFNAVGPVVSVRVCRDAMTRRSLGYAYVNFHQVEDAERSLDTMNFKLIRNQPCRIMWTHRDPALRKSGVGNIFVKNLAKTIDNKQLYDTFSTFGNILSCKVATNSKGEPLGYGFVHYETEKDAQKAIQLVDGNKIEGNKVCVVAFKSKSERTNNNLFKFTNVFVKNLPSSWTEHDIANAFGPYGEITSLYLAKDETGKSKEFAFVNFASHESATAAIDGLTAKVFDEKPLYLNRAQSREERHKELRERYEQRKLDNQKKHAGTNLFVKNLPDTMTDAKLSEIFNRFGSITSVKIMRDQEGHSKGFGFVCFNQAEEAQKAMAEMNGVMFEHKPLYVAMHQRKELRRALLQQQMSHRMKMTHMYPGTPAPVFYPAGPMPQRNYPYPQQMVTRQWNAPQSGVPMMSRNPVNYQLMQLSSQRIPPAGPRGAAGGRGGGRGGLRQGGLPGKQQGGAPYNVRSQARPEAALPEDIMAQPLTIKALAAAPEELQKQMIGEKLFPQIKLIQPELAGKITGMLLEMDNGELLHLLESRQALEQKVAEAVQVLQQAGQE